jgi:toxin ParE1/3/4
MPRRRAEYRLAPAAEHDLEGIWLYTLEEWGIEQANRYADELIAAFDQLAKNPQRGKSCDHIREGYCCGQTGRHVIFFQITEYGIAVIRVLHALMSTPKHL